MRQAVFEWHEPSDIAVSAVQTLGAAGKLAIDGTMSSFIRPDSTARQATFGRTQRSVSLTSPDDLHLVNFTISGYLNGIPVSKTIAGPNANTVETDTGPSPQYFDIVTSISTTGAVTDVSAGIGAAGFTAPYTYDHHVTTPEMAVQVEATGTINYDFQGTLDDVNSKTGFWFSNLIAGMTGLTTSAFGTLTSPIAFARIKVNSGTGSLVATFLQQGFGGL